MRCAWQRGRVADMASAEEELARGTAVGDGGEITVEAGCRYESAL